MISLAIPLVIFFSALYSRHSAVNMRDTVLMTLNAKSGENNVSDVFLTLFRQASQPLH